VAVVVYDGLAMFEFGVACDVFGLDRSERYGVPWYRLLVCAAEAGPVRSDAGLELVAPHGLGPIDRASTVVVPPTQHPERVSEEVLRALRRAYERGARVLSLCTGAFVLAAAGLLDGRSVTTHWEDAAELARRHPDASVDPNVLYVEDGAILTSAGSAASIDLCLYVVQRDFGAEIAARLARELVIPLHRDGEQAQYIDKPLPVVTESEQFLETLVWMQEHLNEALTVDELARRALMSRRTFQRHFEAATGTTPYRWLLRGRIELAQRLLETSDLAVDAVAEASGFVGAANLRKHFAAILRTSPQAYRRAFRAA
jgi:transcriptional regulator GlxA family with amidase domain